jgi:cardiolipin synthase
MRDAGVEVAWFNPISLARFRPDLLNFRTHRKIVICDGHVGFTGGINVSDDDSFQVKGKDAWRDTHLRIEGPPVGWLQVVFLEDWHFATGSAPRHAAYFPDRREACDGPWVQIIASGPDHDLYAIHKFYFTAIAGARQRVLITTPYFVPDESILTALVTAALRGVEVKLLVSTSGSPRLAFAAARSYFEDLVRAGVRIYQYGPAMLHGKTLVVDRDVAVVGTANVDNRSFRLNFEVMAAIYDEPAATLLAEQFEADLGHAKEYRVRDAKRTPLLQRMTEAAARLFSPLL